MIVVATTPADVAVVRGRVAALGANERQLLAPSDGRRLVLAATANEWDEERVVAALRVDGFLAVARPDSGVRLEEWMRHTRPLTFGDRVSVCFAWSEHDRRGLPSVIEVGAGGFGNGEHPATGLVIDTLVDRIDGGERVLDVGCGSGVLGLCSLVLGAAHVVAVDIKAEAVEATRCNAELNDVKVEATLAPLGNFDASFDVVVANIGRAAIVELAPHLARLTSPGGWLAISGISPPQCGQVAEFLHPLVEIERRTSGEWACVVLG